MMRHRITVQVRQPSEICIFCTLRRSRQLPRIRENVQQTYRPFSSSSAIKAPATATAARQDEDDDDFPLLRQNAASGIGTPSTSPDHGAPLPLTRVPKHVNRNPIDFPQRRERDQFRIRRDIVSGAQGNRRPWQRARNDDTNDTESNGTDGNSRADAVTNFRIHKVLLDSSNETTSSFPNRRQNHPRGARHRNIQEKQTHPQGRALDPLSDKTNTIGSSVVSGWRSFVPQSDKQEPETEPKEQSVVISDIKSGPVDSGRPTVANPQHSSQNGHDLLEDERNSRFTSFEPLAEPQAPREETNNPKFRLSNRFEIETDADLPVSQSGHHTKQQGGRNVRKGSQDFDFEMFEAQQALDGGRSRKNKSRKQKPREVVEVHKPTLAIPEFLTVQQLAQSMKVKIDDLIDKLDEEGFEGARYDHVLDAETSAMFADIYGFEPVAGEEEMKDLVARPLPENISDLPPRPPIVTIMGHVDHGKTTILDWLRKSSVAAGEYGGITQHIGAFSVTMPGSERQITFLDTPGHEAFLDMRRRGANVTDIVVLVVAADDSVKPQTVEAIKHALEAKVQLIVAINKVDKHDANIELVKQDLTRHDIVVEDYGGDYQAIPVSGKTGQGMEKLEEAIITLADVLDLRAEQDCPVEGQIIESKVTNAGRVATVLVKRGTLRVGDFVVAGPTWGRVRTLRNDSGKLVQQAFPGDPVQVDGWRGCDPTAGLEVLQADDEQHAKDVVELRHLKAEQAQTAAEVTSINALRTQEAEARANVLAWEAENKVNTRKRRDNEGWVDTVASSGPKKVHFVVKADVAGSVEAIVAAVSAIGNHEVQANVIHHGTGQVTESDIRMLSTTGETGYAISFNLPVEGATQRLAEAAGLQILDYNIIYKVTDVVKEKVSAAIPPSITQRVLGEAEVGQIFDVTIKKQRIKIAGCKVTNGTINRANQVRVIRNGETVYTGTLDSLKNIKKDVTEMRKGTECGMGFKEWEDFQEGDQIQCFEEKEEKRTLY